MSVQRWAGDASQRRAYRLGLDFLNSRGPVVVLELVDEVGDAPRLGGQRLVLPVVFDHLGQAERRHRLHGQILVREQRHELLDAALLRE